MGDANLPFDVQQYPVVNLYWFDRGRCQRPIRSWVVFKHTHNDQKRGVLYEVPTHLKMGDAMSNSNLNYTWNQKGELSVLLYCAHTDFNVADADVSFEV